VPVSCRLLVVRRILLGTKSFQCQWVPKSCSSWFSLSISRSVRRFRTDEQEQSRSFTLASISASPVASSSPADTYTGIDNYGELRTGNRQVVP
jgi:hypothetical protein